jgi:hypothetical protein
MLHTWLLCAAVAMAESSPAGASTADKNMFVFHTVRACRLH